MAVGPVVTIRIIRGVDMPIHCDSRGAFNADYEGERVEDSTIDKLAEKLMRLTKPQEMHIPFCYIGGDNRIKTGVATGIHAGTGQLLLTFDDGTKGRAYQSNVSTWTLPEFKTELLALHIAAIAARDAVVRFIQDHPASVLSKLKP